MGEESSEPASDVKTKKGRPRKPRARKREASKDGGAVKAKRGSSPTQIRDFDLAPGGKESFADFIAEKQPRSQNDKNVVSVYYLSQIAGESGAGSARGSCATPAASSAAAASARVTLKTDSVNPTEAWRLNERLGMRKERTYEVFEKTVR
jgi:hypothetical protein